MTARTRLAAFALVLAAAFGGGAAIGATVGPVDDGDDDPPATVPESPAPPQGGFHEHGG